MRMANAMFMRQAIDAEPVTVTPGLKFALSLATIATVGIGVFPNAFIRAANWSVGITQSAPSVAQGIR